MLKRDLERQLAEWYGHKPRKPLVIRGARQVGKSTLVRNFAASSNLELYEVNLERYPNLADIFKKTIWERS